MFQEQAQRADNVTATNTQTNMKRKEWNKPELSVLSTEYTANSRGNCNGNQDKCAS